MARTAYDPSELPRPMALASVGLLMKTLPLAKVQQALREEGKESQRERQLPAEFLVYLVVSLSLYMPSALREVLRIVLEGLRTWEEVTGGGTIRIATKGAISRACTRLGWEVLKRLFESVAQPQATPRTRGAWYRKWRLMVIDGTSLALQYTEENVKEFGLPDSKHGPGAFPLLRLVALVEVGTWVVTRTAFAPWRTGEMTLAQQVVKGLTSGLLLLEDRGYVGYAWWKEVAETGADILCRVRGNMRFPRLQELPDGSFLSVLKPPQGDPGEPVTVRVIEYGLQGLPNADARYRVITTILDPEAAPARNWRRSITNAGRSKSSWMNSRPTCAGKPCPAPQQDPGSGETRSLWTALSTLHGTHGYARGGATGGRRPRPPLLPPYGAGPPAQASPGDGFSPLPN